MNKINKSLKYYQIETYVSALILQVLVIFFTKYVMYNDWEFGLIIVLLLQLTTLIFISIIISLCLLYTFEKYTGGNLIQKIKDNLILVLAIIFTNVVSVCISFVGIFITSAVTIMTFVFGYLSYFNTVILSIVVTIFQMCSLSYFTYVYYIYIDKNKKTNMLQCFKKSGKYIKNNINKYTSYTSHSIGQYFTLASLSIIYSFISILITQLYFNSAFININTFEIIVGVSMEVLILCIFLSYINNIIENSRIYKKIEKGKKLMLYKELESLIKEDRKE